MCRRFAISLILFVIMPSFARAHDVSLECKQQKGTNKVFVEAFFDDDTPAASAKLEVFDAAKKAIASGKTDAKGLWSFEAPAPGEYRVMLDAGAGHKAEAKITVRPWTNPPADSKGSTPIQEGPSRQEFTRFPWLKVSIGVGVIALFSIAFLISRRKPSVHGSGEPG